MSAMVELAITHGTGLDRYSKPKKCYVTRLTGRHPQFTYMRSFLRDAVQEESVLIPTDTNGVYEVQDWPGGLRRRRYVCVEDGRGYRITEDDASGIVDDVLLAAAVCSRSNLIPTIHTPTGTNMMTMIDAALERLDEARVVVEDPEGDQEDILAALDAVAQVFETARVKA